MLFELGLFYIYYRTIDKKSVDVKALLDVYMLLFSLRFGLFLTQTIRFCGFFS